MAFGNKITKEDLVNAGLDPDKLKEFQEKGVTKEELTALEGRLGTTIADTIKNSLAELEGRLRPQNHSNEEETEEQKRIRLQAEEPSDQDQFMSNPTEYVKKEVGKFGAAAAIEIKKMQRDTAYREASRMLKGFKNDTLKTEIEEEWKKYPAEKMAQFGTDPSLLIVQLHDMIMGRHHDEIQHDTSKREGKYNLVQSGGSGGNNTGAVGDRTDNDEKKEVLSDEEKATAKKFGMTDDEWLAEKKGLTKDSAYIQSGGRG